MASARQVHTRERLRANDYERRHVELNARLCSAPDYETLLALRLDVLALVSRYAWAVPNDEALRAIARLSPLIEVGAGTGYWAAQLRVLGAEVEAFDVAPPPRSNPWHPDAEPFTHIDVGDHTALAGSRAKTLLLCWPPYEEGMATDCLEAFEGERLVYVGELDGGTGDREFHRQLRDEWAETETIAIPQWLGSHDYCGIWARRSRR